MSHSTLPDVATALLAKTPNFWSSYNGGSRRVTNKYNLSCDHCEGMGHVKDTCFYITLQAILTGISFMVRNLTPFLIPQRCLSLLKANLLLLFNKILPVPISPLLALIPSSTLAIAIVSSGLSQEQYQHLFNTLNQGYMTTLDYNHISYWRYILSFLLFY